MHDHDHALRVDIGALKPTEFGRPQAGGIKSGENEAVLEVARCPHDGLDLVSREDDGQRFDFFGNGM
jgi:hypothetical protein